MQSLKGEPSNGRGMPAGGADRGNLAATIPQPGQSWQAAGFEAIITFGLVSIGTNGPLSLGPLAMLRIMRLSAPTSWAGGPWADRTRERR